MPNMTSKNLRKVIGRNIRERRHQHGWKVADLAGEAGLVRGYWYQIELGLPNVTIDALSEIARTLKVSVRDLLAN